MKKLFSAALLLAAIPTAAEAATIVGVYASHGACNSAWSHAVNDTRKGSAATVYWCDQVGGVWMLFSQ
jgi:hypothetical protein